MNPLEVAKLAATQAGKILYDSLGKLNPGQIKNKTLFDYVTDVDQDSERMIIDLIRSHYPEHSIMSEEFGVEELTSQYRWIIDPLDGTTNYIHAFPVCAVSIALEFNEEIILGVIYDPFRDELFSAEKNKGAFLNNNKISVSKEADLSRCLIATGFPFKHKILLKSYWQTFSAIFQKVSGIRRAGSAALDLAYVACGRFDGFWEIKLSPWDVAAGDIIVREAGGKLTDVIGEQNHRSTGNIIAANPLIHETILAAVKSVFTKNP